ncbi:MAG: response regulator [Candidatus Aquicultor secundus]|nr:response regulator [Candidatus Aquicultor secundus]NCO66578.1 response regulator [Solirubrobacter sp.]OIO85541.1 MAG: response regulator [Candidatus Aquicultor secundus]PIU26833.1 MAG: response regulator [Candidatus Aquicultor secundus]PIW21453.1 MAG: response regulator [Candidatus Aquicultor secundus]PIX52174.1 MAG: response regulator [Candidatus Aquicultor secundus]
MARLRILIAEDEAIIRLDLKEMLVELGHAVVGEAWDGETALELAETLHPDLAILDIKMPGMNGIEAARAITAAGICPVVMLTAYSQKSLVEEAIKAGAMAYLVKPFDKSDLMPAIEVARSRFLEMKELGGQVKGLEERLEARKIVERAKGVLMKEHGLNEADAFKQLQKWSMDKQLSLKQVAETVLGE